MVCGKAENSGEDAQAERLLAGCFYCFNYPVG